MIQRIQSLYLIITVILTIIFAWIIFQGSFDLVITLAILSSVISFITIFDYNNRQRQFVLCRINIIVNFSILLSFYFLNDLLTTENIINIACIILLVMANKAIKKDEDLIRSIDRIR